MRILFFTTLSDPGSTVPDLADEQILCGPGWPDHRAGDLWISLAMPADALDIDAVLSRLPVEPAPDAVVCLVDAARPKLPRQLTQFTGPKILLLANLPTSGPASPGLLGYIATEKFDRIAIVDDLRPCLALRAAGIDAGWFPGLALGYDEHALTATRLIRRTPALFHATNRQTDFSRLNPFIGALRVAGHPVDVSDLDQPFDGLGTVATSLHLAPAGNFPVECLLALGGGAAVLCERPHAESGFADILTEGRDWIGFSDETELIAVATRFRRRPLEIRKLGLSGVGWFDRNLGGPSRRRAFRHWVQAGTLPGPFAQVISQSKLTTSSAIYALPRVSPKTRQAQRLLAQGDYPQALSLATTAVAETPDCMLTHLVLADLAREAGHTPVLEKLLVKLRVLAPHDPRVDHLAKNLRLRLPSRLLHDGWEALSAQRWQHALVKSQRATHLVHGFGEAHHALGRAHLGLGNQSAALAAFLEAVRFVPHRADIWFDLGMLQRQIGIGDEAIKALSRAVELAPSSSPYRLALAEAQCFDGQPESARETLSELQQRRPGHRTAAALWAQLRVDGERISPSPVQSPAITTARDLLICGSEMCRRHGTGILMQRAYSDSSDFVVLRSQTLYDGNEEFGGSHVVLDAFGLTAEERRRRMRRLLAPFNIRRILCVPFGPEDFHNAIEAKAMLGVPLCTYVMDDQAAYSTQVSAHLARSLFEASQLRLAISREMAGTYEHLFGTPFDLLPPIVTSHEGEVHNHWTPRLRSALHGIMIGNVWSLAQFAKLRELVLATGLVIDWFGNPDLVLSRYDRNQLTREGIHCRGLVAESDLARTLAEFPFTIVLSGELDGRENNEWLSRLSLPSRMIFILTKTRTPMLVLGSPDTCAARVATGLGIGINSPYEAATLKTRVGQLSNAGFRQRLVDRAHAIAPAFVMPDAGRWTWDSLAAGHALPAAFDALFAVAPVTPSCTTAAAV